MTTMPHAEFRRRLRALGLTTPGPAAKALGLDRSAVHRMFKRQRDISPRTAHTLALLEAAQPAPITPQMARVLETAAAAEPGTKVEIPARGPGRRVVRWSKVLDKMEDAGMIEHSRGEWRLTELGARSVAFLRR